jgi:hypothetical protein
VAGTDDYNCGACGFQCGAGQDCIAGDCVCAGGGQPCGEDPALGLGTCCAAGEACINGGCVPTGICDGAAGTCNNYTACDPGCVCALDEGGAVVCAGIGSCAGQTCDDSDACPDGFFCHVQHCCPIANGLPGICVPLCGNSPAGYACTVDENCASGICDESSGTCVDQPGIATCAPCTEATDCESGVCTNSVCQPSDPNALPAGWHEFNFGTGADAQIVCGPPTPPVGPTSLEMTVGANGGDAVRVGNTTYVGTTLASITALSYSTYVQGGGVGGQAPYLVIAVDTTGDGNIDDRWFFEPVYQTATYCPENPQPAIALNTWQTWDALNGCWYSVNGFGGFGPGANVGTFAEMKAAFPTATIVNDASGNGGVRLQAGGGNPSWNNFIGNADALVINSTTHDF